MPQGQVLEFSGATKRFGAVTAVSDFTARVEPGVVTGFLGPNGAGKTTSLRMLLGLVRPTAGTATIDGVGYAKLKHPLQTVGAVLEASSFHPGRTGAGHLSVYAKAARIPKARIDEVLGLVGLADAAGRKVGGYSLGMRQRLGLAYALLGDPGVLVLDEPTNGLDPEGIKWIRGFLRQLAREGRTVFVSSHLLAEVQQTVDALLIISAGRLVFQGDLEELSDPAEQATVVDSADRPALAAALTAAGIPYEVLRSGLTVRGIEPVSVGLAAAAAGVPLTSLHKRGPALEEVFLDLVNGTRVHASASGLRMDDVIPAIESGPIDVIEIVEETDAAPAADGEDAPAPEHGDDAAAVAAEAAEAVEPAESGEVPEDSIAEVADEPVESADLPEAEEADAASVAEELEAAAAGPGAAGAMGAAAGMAWVQEEEARADEPSPRTASFAVASTGVIDVIPAEADADAEPEAEPEAAAEPETAADDDAEFADAPETDDDRSWDEYVKTDADLEADRFFAAFDDAAAAAAAADAGETRESDTLEGEPAGDPEPESEASESPGAEHEHEAEAAPEHEAEAAPEHEHEHEAEAEAEHEHEAEAAPEHEHEAEADPEGDPEGDPQADAEPEGEASESRRAEHEGEHPDEHHDHDGGEHR